MSDIETPTLGETVLISGRVPPSSFDFEKLSPLVLRFLNRLKRTGRSPNTISSYRNDLSFFSQFLVSGGFDPQLYSTPIQEEWLHYLGEHGRKSPASLRRAQMSVRTFLHFLIEEKIISGSPLLEIKSPRQPSHALLTILPEHYHKLVKTLKAKALEGNEKAIRDWAIVQILGECGLKASEASNLTWSDFLIQPGGGTASAPDSHGTVRVAGTNERILDFGANLANSLEMLKSLRISMELDAGPKARLFFGYRNVTRSVRTASLHRHGIKFVVYEVCEEILGIPYNSESLRNRAILSWLEKGLSSETVCELAGYSSMNSLERFSPGARGIRKPRRRLKSVEE